MLSEWLGVKDEVKVSVATLDYYLRHENAIPPKRATAASIGYDLAADDEYVIEADERALVGTGVVLKPPSGFWVMLALRSSMGKRGLILTNGVGVVDPDYIGEADEVMFSVWNRGASPIVITPGERIGQAILLPAFVPELSLFEPSSSSRGGFGSTGR